MHSIVIRALNLFVPRQLYDELTNLSSSYSGTLIPTKILIFLIIIILTVKMLLETFRLAYSKILIEVNNSYHAY